ncbi:MAG: PAS domain S-box protein [Vicinamibacterales bacterium]
MSDAITRPEGSLAAPARHVLVVDDNAVMLRLARARFAAAGYDVTTASGPAEALDKARAHMPDAIVCDVMMQELDGFALCGVFRAEPGLAEVPILLVSAHVDGDDAHKMALAAGASTLLERSPDWEEELRVLGALVEDPRAAMSGTGAWQPEPYVRRLAAQLAQLLARSRRSEQYYRGLLESATDGIVVLSLSGIVLEMNRRWEALLGAPRTSLVGRHMQDFFPASLAEGYLALFESVVTSGTMPSTGPVSLVRADGTTMVMDFSATRISTANEEVVLGIGRDLTEVAQAQRDLAGSEHRYRALVESLPDVVWIARPDGTVTFVSSQIATITGTSPEELLHGSGGSLLARVHAEDADRVREAFGDLVAGRALVDAEFRVQHRDGHWIWVHVRAARRTEDGASVLGGLLSDISARKSLEEQVRLSQRMEAVGQLTAGIAHDFNNLLSVILGAGQTLRDSFPGDDLRATDADAVVDAAGRAATLTRQLLAFSRRQVLELRTLDLNDIVRSVDRVLRRAVGERIDVRLRLAEALEPVRVDAGQIEQVLMNLAVNARDAMPDGGTLAIETSNVELDTAYAARHTSVVSGRYVLVTVSDTGCGMDAQTARRVFEPFFTTKERGRGTGLGLSTCYGIVKQSGGYIWVYSEPHRGTVFKVYLPRDRSGLPQLMPTAEPAVQAASAHETVLLVEDDGLLQRTIRRILERLGYTVLAAGSVGQAAALYGAEGVRVDLVLTDVVLPDGTGPDLVARLREAGGRPRVLYMSGYTEHSVFRDRQMGPGERFIQKPFTPAVIARKLREVLTVDVSH